MEAQSLKDVKTIHDGSLAKSFLSTGLWNEMMLVSYSCKWL